MTDTLVQLEHFELLWIHIPYVTSLYTTRYPYSLIYYEFASRSKAVPLHAEKRDQKKQTRQQEYLLISVSFSESLSNLYCQL